MRPVVALYSTFLQRAFDQTVHDVCQNDAPVVIAVDRAGLVGEDGTSHQGMFTIPAQRQLPNLVVASPRTSRSCARCCARRSRRTTRSRSTTRATRASASPSASPTVLPVGRGEVLREGRDLLFVGVRADRRARRWRPPTRSRREGWSVGVVNARFAKPLDRAADPRPGARQAARGDVRGERRRPAASGPAVLEAIEEARLADPAYRDVPVRIIGIPGDRFVDHGSVADLRRLLRLDVPGPRRPRSARRSPQLGLVAARRPSPKPA